MAKQRQQQRQRSAGLDSAADEGAEAEAEAHGGAALIGMDPSLGSFGAHKRAVLAFARAEPALVPLSWLSKSTIEAALYADVLRREGAAQRKLRNAIERLWAFVHDRPPGGNGQASFADVMRLLLALALDKDTVQFDWARVWFRNDEHPPRHYSADEQQEARAVVGALMLLRDIVRQASKSYYLQLRGKAANDLYIRRTGPPTSLLEWNLGAPGRKPARPD